MSDYDPNATPPSEPDFLDDDIRPRPAWPKVVGIVSICWGALGIVCNGVNAVWMALMPSLMQSAEAEMQGGFPPAISNPNPLLIAMGVVGLLWSIVLVVAGAMTVARKPAGRMAHLVWAAGGIILAVAGIYFSLQMQNEIAEWVKDNPSSDFAQNSSPSGGYIGLAVGIVLGFAWPLFILIWFLTVKRDSAQIAEGVDELTA